MRLRALAALVGCLLFASAALGNGPRTVRVSNTAQLYAAVNNAHNDDVTIVLASGKYVLSEAAWPANLGRLTLRQGMNLIGQDSFKYDFEGVPTARDGKHGEVFALPATETTIDGSGLLGDDTSGAGSRGVIEAGVNNRIEGVTVLGNAEVTAAITVLSYPQHGGMSVEIVGCDLQGVRRGVQMSTGGAANAVNTALIANNVIRHNNGAFGFGVQLLQFGASGERLIASVLSNRMYDNFEGLFLPMLGSSHSETQVLSAGNIYQFNFIGITIYGSRDFGLPFGQPLPPGVPFPDDSYDQTWLDSWGDLIANNTDPNIGEGAGAGMFIIGAFRDCPQPGNEGNADGCPIGPNGGDISHTQVHVSLHGARFIDGAGDQNGNPASPYDWAPVRVDMQVIGEWSDNFNLAGTNDVTSISIEDSLSDGASTAIQYANTDPAVVDTSGTDRVGFSRHNNIGVPKPEPVADDFF